MRWFTRSAKPLPLPPEPMRALVGRPEPELFEAPDPALDALPSRQFRSILDFGCGCGRQARLVAARRPKRYVGIDLHRGMIDWDNAELASRLPGFSFHHHNVFNAGLNPDPSLPRSAPLPVPDRSVTLMLATSVFTHLAQPEAESYLDEAARVLAEDGVLMSTFFLFEKSRFPMMQDFQNALYINPDDPTNAVIFDRTWLLAELDRRGLRVSVAKPPNLRGFHWLLQIEPGRGSVDLPPDDAPPGRHAPPVFETPAHAVGSDQPEEALGRQLA